LIQLVIFIEILVDKFIYFEAISSSNMRFIFKKKKKRRRYMRYASGSISSMCPCYEQVLVH
jgi:hypothetical protein